MYKIYPTLVDSIEYLLDREFEDAEQERAKLVEIRDQVMGIRRTPTDAMIRGLAFHQIVEQRGEPGGDVQLVTGPNGAQVYQVTIRDRAVDPSGAPTTFVRLFEAHGMREFCARLPAGAMHEVKESLVIDDVVVTFKCDALIGLDVHEFKSKEKEPNPDDYIETLQWRLYLQGFGARRMNYHVAQLRQDKRTEVFAVERVHEFSQFAYPGMEADIRRRVFRAIDFIDALGLLEHITLKEAA